MSEGESEGASEGGWGWEGEKDEMVMLLYGGSLTLHEVVL